MDGTLSKTNLGIVPRKPRTETVQHLPSDDKSSASHRESKWDRQMRVLKENFGPASLLSIIAIVCSLVTVAFLIGSPIVSQAGRNEATATGLDNIRTAVKENEERQTKALSEAVIRIEASVNRSVELAVQNQSEVRSMRESFDRRIDQVANKADAAWNNMVELKGRIGKIEAAETKKE